jgi:hypothetical protein
MLNKMLGVECIFCGQQTDGQKPDTAKRTANTKQPRLTTQRHVTSMQLRSPFFFFSSTALQINCAFD